MLQPGKLLLVSFSDSPGTSGSWSILWAMAPGKSSRPDGELCCEASVDWKVVHGVTGTETLFDVLGGELMLFDHEVELDALAELIHRQQSKAKYRG